MDLNISKGSQSRSSRRERGVIAQREYRKRHANKFKQIQDENDRLKEALRDILETSEGHRLPPRVHIAVNKAKTLMEADGDNESSHEEKPDSNYEQRQTTSHSSLQALKPGNMDSKDPKATSSSVDDINGPTAKENGETGTSTPMSQYLGENMFTLEGRLFWDAMTYLIIQLQKDILHNETGSLKASAFESEDDFDHELTVALGSARLQHHQSIAPDANPNDFPPALRKISERQQNFRSSAIGRTADFWKTPEEVAEYLLENLDEVDVKIIKDSLAGRLPADVERNVGSRIMPFARNAVYFPDGPRWGRLFLSLAVGIWVNGTYDLNENR